MKILLTGTHFTPAQAVIEELIKDKTNKISYIGRATTQEGDSTTSVESAVLPKLGVKFYPVIAGRLQRNLTLYTLPSLLKIPIGFIQSFYFLVKEKPDVVLAFGGYVSVPVVIAAWLLSIKIMVHEQTLVVGLASQICRLFADKVALSFDQGQLLLRNQILSGNPIRSKLLDKNITPSIQVEEFFHQAKKANLPVIFITGGNQGSHLINETIKKMIDPLTKKYLVIHQTGDSKFKDYESLQSIKINLQFRDRYLIKKWFDVSDLGFIFTNIYLSITRAGINTLCELGLFAVPSIVIPIPYIFKDEQSINAQYFHKLGLVEIISQDNLTVDNLFLTMTKITRNYTFYKQKTLDSQLKINVNAAKILAQEVLLLGRKHV